MVAPTNAESDGTGQGYRDFVGFERFLDCVHCGLCIPACPTFLELGTEMDSPRGRIQLMRSLHEGRLPLDDKSVLHLDSCLGCRACETACPSGVRYGELIEGARGLIETNYPRSFRKRMQRWAINRVFPNPWAMRQFSRITSVMMCLQLHRLRGSSWLPSVCRQVLRYLPEPRARFGSASLKQHVSASGEQHFRVGLLSGCIMPNLFGATQSNTVKLLSQNGCDVTIPAGAGCCGALLLHNGARKRGLKLARQVIRAFDARELDAIITNAAGCGAALKEYAEHFKNEPELRDAAARVSSKVKDIAEFLAEIPDLEPRREIRARVTYHDPCHLLNGQGVKNQPRDLLCKIPGLEVVELAESEICCGSAGTYNLTQPGLALRLGERKAQHVVESGADIVVTGNPGCIIQIQAALQDRAALMQVVHTVDILAQAYTDND